MCHMPCVCRARALLALCGLRGERDDIRLAAEEVSILCLRIFLHASRQPSVSAQVHWRLCMGLSMNLDGKPPIRHPGLEGEG